MILFALVSLYSLAAVATLVAGVLSLRERGRYGVAVGSLLLACSLVIAICITAMFIPSALPESILLSGAYLCALVLSILVFRFIWVFTGLPRGMFLRASVAIIGAVAIGDSLFIIFNPLTNVLGVLVDTSPLGPVHHWVPIRNWPFYLHAVICYVILVFSLVLLYFNARETPRFYRYRCNALLVAMGIPVVFNVVFVIVPIDPAFDPTLLVFGVSSLGIYWIMFRYNRKRYLEQLSSMVIEHIGAPIALFDQKGHLVFHNRDIEMLFPFLREEELSLGGFAKKVSMGKMLEPGTRLFEWNRFAKDGSVVSYNCELIHLQQDNRAAGSLLTMHDRSFDTDLMTGVYDRGSYIRWRNELERHPRYPTEVIFINLNRLDELNRFYSYRVGDAMVVSFGRALTKAGWMHSCYTARVSSDDFCVILSGQGREEAERYIADLEEALEWDVPEGFEAGFGYGMAIWDGPGRTLEEVIQSAREGMVAKKMMDPASSRSALVAALSQTLIERDYETEEHVQRTARLAMGMGRRLGFSEADRGRLVMLATLHDVGKLGVSDSILLKPGTLTREEFDAMRVHTEAGFRIVSSSNLLRPIAEGVRHHHERWDGAGYPDGLKGTDIPIDSRIVSIVDAYDAMTHDRIYRKAITHEEACEEIRRCAGTQFDPDLSQIFFEVLEEAL